ncbi:MAG: cell division protein FtsA [Muribaculaceae bacterium]|nr:cell division protein FtsA [Muribaculaceae bacterium]
MEKNQYIVAFEIGSSKIVGAIADKSSSGYVTVRMLEEERLINSVRHGEVKNVENIKGAINRILRRLENRINGRITEVFVGISGRSLHSEITEANRDLDSSNAITDQIIDRIIQESMRTTSNNYDTIDVVPRAFYVDNKETDSPSGQFGSKISIKLNRIVAKPAIKISLKRVMEPTIEVRRYIVTPLAAADEILSPEEKSLGCMFVDMGAETTEVAIYKNGSLLYFTTLPLGGRNITKDIENGLTIIEADAERVKKNIHNPLELSNESINIEGVNSADAAQYISARAGEIIANIIRQIPYANLNNEDIKNIVLIGGGAQLQGFNKKLEEAAKINVRTGTVPHTLNILDQTINRPEYIQILSLLAKGAEILTDGESCIEIITYDDGGTGLHVNTAPKTEPVPEVKPEKKPEKPKKSKWKFISDKLGSLLQETDSEDM